MTFTYEGTASDIKRERQFVLEVFENDGLVGLGLSLDGDDFEAVRQGIIEPEEIAKVIKGLNEAVARARKRSESSFER